jgi:hypothetical protein
MVRQFREAEQFVPERAIEMIGRNRRAARGMAEKQRLAGWTHRILPPGTTLYFID